MVSQTLGNVFPISEALTKAIDAANIPSFLTPEEAAKAMSALIKYAEIKRHLNESGEPV